MALIDSKTAEQLYYENKKKYNNAYNERCASQKKENGYISQKKQIGSQLYANNCRKNSIEQRLVDIEMILKKLLGNGGWMTQSVPEAISDASNSLAQLSEGFRAVFTLEGGSVSAAHLNDIFEIHTVEKDTYLSYAAEEFKREKVRLETELAEVKRKIANASSAINDLQQKINQCNVQQAKYTKQMTNCALEMSYYKKFMR